jgi:hypothetical protein
MGVGDLSSVVSSCTSPPCADLYGGGGALPSSNATSAFSTCTSALTGEREGLCLLQRSEQNFGTVLVLLLEGSVFLDGLVRFDEMMRPQVWQ